MPSDHFSPVSSWVALGIPALALSTVGLFAWATAHATPTRKPRAAALAGAGAAAWLGLTGLAAGSGLLARFELRPPPFLLLMGASVALAIALGVSRLGKSLAGGIPLAAL